MRDAVEPRPQRKLAVAGSKSGVGAHEDILQSILGVLPATRKHLSRIGEQPLVVAVMNDPERLVVTGAEQGHELLIRAQTE